MCGIAGIINKKSDASSMIQKITHRGPDHHQTINLKNASLAFSRLSIIDLSEDLINHYMTHKTKSTSCLTEKYITI